MPSRARPPAACPPGACAPTAATRPRRGDDAALAALAKAVAHPARLKIVRLLRQRAGCVCGEIVAELPLAQSTVSQHLKILKRAGLVQGEIDGPRTCYCLDATALALLKRLISDL